MALLIFHLVKCLTLDDWLELERVHHHQEFLDYLRDCYEDLDVLQESERNE